MLEAHDVHQSYGGSHILRGVSLDVPAASCTCVLGRNGVGKTTLLRALMGLVPVRRGAVRLDGRSIGAEPPDARARAGLAYVPQGREIFPHLTARENLELALLGAGPTRRELPGEIFRLFPALGSLLRRRGGDLSGGQQQQLAIARALVLRPRCILLDEPTEGIQPNLVHELGAIIRRLVSEVGLAVLLVEQKLPFARRVGDRFYVMNRGAVVASGTHDELTDDVVREHLTV